MDWRDVGFEKVHGVKRRLLNSVPTADVQLIESNLNWQRSAAAHSSEIDRLAACDLIVDATGDTPTSLLLGAIAAENGRPFVSIEVYEGGLGASIARSVPDRDPPYAAGRQAYAAYCDQQNVQPPTSGTKSYEALFDGAPVVADDAAVTAAAAHASRCVLDILDGRVGPADGAWLLLGFRQGWLFNGLGHNVLLDVGAAVAPADGAEPVDPLVQEFAFGLAREAVDAAKSSG